MDTIEKQKHIRLRLAFNDLMECKEYAGLLNIEERGELGSKDRTIYTAILTAFVVSYGRAISRSNTENKKFDKDVSIFFKDIITQTINTFTNKQQILHSQLKDQRDQVFAHSDAKGLGLTPFSVPLGGIAYISSDTSVGFENHEKQKIIEIVHIFINAIQNEIEHLEKTVGDALL